MTHGGAARPGGWAARRSRQAQAARTNRRSASRDVAFSADRQRGLLPENHRRERGADFCADEEGTAEPGAGRYRLWRGRRIDDRDPNAFAPLAPPTLRSRPFAEDPEASRPP